MGGIQEEDFKGDEGQVEEDEMTDDGSKECGEGVEDRGLGPLRWFVEF